MENYQFIPPTSFIEKFYCNYYKCNEYPSFCYFQENLKEGWENGLSLKLIYEIHGERSKRDVGIEIPKLDLVNFWESPPNHFIMQKMFLNSLHVFESLDKFLVFCFKNRHSSDENLLYIVYNQVGHSKIIEFQNLLFKNFSIPDKQNKQEEKDSSLNLLFKNYQGFYLEKAAPKEVKCDLDLNYGSGFKEKYDKLFAMLKNEDEGGLYLLHGSPGCGKTSLLRKLMYDLEGKKVVFLPPNMASSFSDPSFLPFLVKFKIDVIVCEDAELMLIDRDTGHLSSAISPVLNVTDGILGDILNVKILATFNTPLENVDKALLRKGRLKFMEELKPLNLEDTNKLLRHLNRPESTRPQTLAEIYNPESNGVEAKERKMVGFGA